MFEDITIGPPQLLPGLSRGRTAAISFTVHLLVVIALAISALFVSVPLPEPSTVMVFVADAPLPSPPAAPMPSERRRDAESPQASARSERVLPEASAPIEAPAGIAQETEPQSLSTDAASATPGLEGGISGGIIGGVSSAVDYVVPPAPPPSVQSSLVRVGGDITPPRLIRRVDPQYPPLAQAAQVQGMVILEAIVSELGFVESLVVLRAPSLLERAALDAVKQWQYEPLVLNGVARRFMLTVTISFHMSNAAGPKSRARTF